MPHKPMLWQSTIYIKNNSESNNIGRVSSLKKGNTCSKYDGTATCLTGEVCTGEAC